MRSIRQYSTMACVAFAIVATACADSAAPTAMQDEALGGASLSKLATTAELTVQVTLDTIAVGDTAHARVVGALVGSAPLTYTSNRPGVLEVTADGSLRGLKLGTSRLVALVQTAGTTDGHRAFRDIVVARKSGTRKPFPASTPTPVPVPVPTPVPTPTPTTPTTAWTYCTNAGAACDFLGLRDVRLADPSGTKAVTLVAYHTIPCAVYGFNDQNPANGQSLHCDYGPVKTTTLTNPSPGMGGLGSQVVVPMGSPGVGVAQTRPGSRGTYADGSGAFRSTCSLASFQFNDPIVYPGQPGASHLHAFFGNTGVNANSTSQTIASSGNSTCLGGILNRTAYWVPALIDSRDGTVQLPDEGVFYYKTGYQMDPASIKPIPAGLRMIAGNKLSTSKQEYIGWSCRDKYMDEIGTVPTTCPIGDAVRLTVEFPQCWDGKNLDSPDHKSHMAYPIYSNAHNGSRCPADHPVPLPEITEHFEYPMTKTSQPAFWRLSSDMYSSSMPGGLSAHADWMGGWDPTTINTFVTQCLNKALDCGVASIGNGLDLY